MNDLTTPAPAQTAPSGPVKPAARSRIDFSLALQVAGALVVIVMASVQIYDILRRLDIVLETAQQSDVHLARVLAEQTRSALQAVDVVVQDATVMTDQLRANHPLMHERLRDRIKLVPQIRELLLSGPDGSIVAAGTDTPPLRDWVAQQQFFLVHRQQPSAGLFVSAAFHPEGSATWMIALSRRIADANGGFQGVATAWLDLD